MGDLMKRVMMLATTVYMHEKFNKDNILILRKLGYEVDVVANLKVRVLYQKKQLITLKIGLLAINVVFIQ